MLNIVSLDDNFDFESHGKKYAVWNTDTIREAVNEIMSIVEDDDHTLDLIIIDYYLTAGTIGPQLFEEMERLEIQPTYGFVFQSSEISLWRRYVKENDIDLEEYNIKLMNKGRINIDVIMDLKMMKGKRKALDNKIEDIKNRKLPKVTPSHAKFCCTECVKINKMMNLKSEGKTGTYPSMYHRSTRECCGSEYMTHQQLLKVCKNLDRMYIEIKSEPVDKATGEMKYSVVKSYRRNILIHLSFKIYKTKEIYSGVGKDALDECISILENKYSDYRRTDNNLTILL